ncbi:MAG: DUF177 domain-containing protein [Nitrospirota bacterium]
MKIAIEDILDEGLNLDIEEEFSLENHSLVSPVTAHLGLRKTGQEIIINGELRAELEFQCSRCLKKFIKHLAIPIEVVYHPLEELSPDKHELKNDEMDMGFYTGEEIDLQDILKEQILLNIQIKTLCDENCKGICSKCGSDLNIETCNCGGKEPDQRLEVLKKIFEKRKE